MEDLAFHNRKHRVKGITVGSKNAGRLTFFGLPHRHTERLVYDSEKDSLLLQDRIKGVEMKNKVELEGILKGWKVFSDHVGSAQLQVTTQYKGKSFDQNFFITVFKDCLEQVGAIPLGSVLSISGKLKNGFYEKDGGKIWKLEVIMLEGKILKRAESLDEGDDGIPF